MDYGTTEIYNIEVVKLLNTGKEEHSYVTLDATSDEDALKQVPPSVLQTTTPGVTIVNVTVNIMDGRNNNT